MLIVLQWLFSFYRARATVRSSIALLSWLCFLVKLLCIGPVLRWLCSYHVGWSQHVVAAQIHPQLSIWSVMALRLDICSHVSLVWPTWHLGRLWSSASHRLAVLPVCLSTVGRQAFPVSGANTQATTFYPTSPLYSHSQFSDSVSKHSYFPIHTRGTITWLTFSYCICGPSHLYFSFYQKYASHQNFSVRYCCSL